MAFIPNISGDVPGTGDFVVNQKNGTSIFVKSNGDGTFTPQVVPFASVTNVYSAGSETGLLGVAFPPDFITNPWVYFFHTMDNPRQNCVVRYKVGKNAQNQVVVDPTTYQIVLDGIITNSSNHNAGHIKFDNVGNLYISTGDAGTRTNSQNLGGLNGKILRILPTPQNAVNGRYYTIPSGNPFATSLNNRQEIWCYGLRNPFTFDIHPHTQKIYVCDVGQDTWEEINDATTPANFGWGIYEGMSGGNPQNLSMYRDPIYVYSHTGSTGLVAITGACFYHYHSLYYPAAFEGGFFFGDYGFGFIKMLESDNTTVVNTLTNLAYPTGPIDIQMWNGRAYYTALDGRIRAINYS